MLLHGYLLPFICLLDLAYTLDLLLTSKPSENPTLPKPAQIAIKASTAFTICCISKYTALDAWEMHAPLASGSDRLIRSKCIQP